MRNLFVFLTLGIVALIATTIYAGDKITGQVINEKGQPISHVTIRSNDITNNVQTNNDGRFEVQLSASGKASLALSHTGYIPRLIKVAPADKDIIITMETQIYPMRGITVTAGQAIVSESPVAFQNIDRETIDRDFDIGEVPELLELTPNLYSYSDAGGGLGYSYLSIRGFNARQAPVYINGIPLNDPEDHSLYFIDLPDFSSYADNIQVQRGAGNSLYGDPAFGGSVNILTSPLSHKPETAIETGYGGFLQDGNTVGLMRKSSLFYSSGLMDNGWSLSTRLVKQFSEGYREKSWYDGSAYYLSLGNIGTRMITTLNIYGGPIKTHAAWEGIDRATMFQNRRTNWYSYNNETDNFNQPHVELHNIYNLSENISLNNSLYYIRGNGYYEQLKDDEYLWEYNLTPDKVIVGDIIRQKWVKKDQYGINSHVDFQSENRKAVIGGSYYYFQSEHWGKVISVDDNSISPPRYYEYFGKYHNFSTFASIVQKIDDNITATGSLQLRYLHKDIGLTPIGIFGEMAYNLDWLFLSPRVGINYNINEKVSSYLSFSVASHEPNDDMIDDADNPFDRPNLEIIDSTVSPILYGGSKVGAERIYDFEFGVNYHASKVALEANLFWMEYCNALVPDGDLTDDGFPTYGNSARSLHRGIELSGMFQILQDLKIEGNYAFNDFWIKKYDQNNLDGTMTRHRDVATPNFPQYLANLIINYDRSPFGIIYRLRAVGRQFISLDGRYATINGISDDISIAPNTISSLKGIVKISSIFKSADITLEARVDNLFDKKYETFGYRWGDYTFYWPAAERNWFVNIKLAI